MGKFRKVKRIVLVLLCSCFIGVACYYYYFIHYTRPVVVANQKNGAESKYVKNMSDKEFSAYLQGQADKSQFRLKMESDMFFEKADKVGKVTILNPNSNHYAIRVQTTIENQEAIIYDSGMIKPKQFVENGELKKVIPQGVYKVNHHVIYYELTNLKQKVGETVIVGQLAINQ
ncbi:hypothetical protein ABE905_12895 [Enterococcus durans]|uniref:hypothetical protein n=1 Tax=Enterococcus durans TaxID=53345 RepID=UPI003D6A5FA1